MSGVVVAGFGNRDLFPSFKSFIVEGIVNGKLRAVSDGNEKITLARIAFIRQFAQGETVAAFMEGAHPRYQAIAEKSLEDALREYLDAILDAAERETKKKLAPLRKKMESSRLQVTKRIRDHLKQIRQNEFARPIVQTVAVLPKDEMAAMAETLVNLTSIRQRYSTEVETVGGPIDVAVISKGDGFIWIKRKHYFDKEHNPQFFARYYRKGGMRVDEEG
jgi:ribosomal protein L29